MKNNYLKGFGLYLIIFICIISAILISRNFDTNRSADNIYSYSELIKQLENKDPDLIALEIQRNSEGDNEGEVRIAFSNKQVET